MLATALSLVIAAQGTLCVDPLPKASLEPVMNPNASKVRSSYRVRVDRLAWQTVTRANGATFGLEGDRHLVTIAIGPRVIESFWVSFDTAPALHLRQRPGYFTFELIPGPCP